MVYNRIGSISTNTQWKLKECTRQCVSPAVLKGAVAGIASIAMLMSVSVTANAADTPSYGSAVKPNITSLLGEYYKWWTPKKVVNNTPQGDAFRGKVTDAGKSVLGQNDKTVVAINNKAAADTTKVDGTYTQAERAALDASDGDALRIYKDAFGPIIGQYVAEGVAQGELPKTSDLVFSKSSKDSFAGFVGTGSAKKDFNYPRPYFNKENEGVDRTIGGDTDLNGLSSTLDIKRIPMINIDGQEYGEDYTDYQEPSQSFPSGHTTKTYNRGLGLATLLPELGPELVARAAEGGNNRVVLGVHYPMDVIGGRISASASVTALWSDATFRQNVLLPAHDELENYIAARCKADGQRRHRRRVCEQDRRQRQERIQEHLHRRGVHRTGDRPRVRHRRLHRTHDLRILADLGRRSGARRAARRGEPAAHRIPRPDRRPASSGARSLRN